MKSSAIIGYALLHAGGAVAYIALVATVMTRAEHLVKPFEGSVLPPVLFLSLFVLSAAVMGLTLFGRPVLWFLEGKKKEAIMLAICTMLFLAFVVVAIFTFVATAGGEIFAVAF